MNLVCLTTFPGSSFASRGAASHDILDFFGRELDTEGHRVGHADRTRNLSRMSLGRARQKRKRGGAEYPLLLLNQALLESY